MHYAIYCTAFKKQINKSILIISKQNHFGTAHLDLTFNETNLTDFKMLMEKYII